LSYKDWLKKLEQQWQDLKKRPPIKKQTQGQATGGVDVLVKPTEYTDLEEEIHRQADESARSNELDEYGGYDPAKVDREHEESLLIGDYDGSDDSDLKKEFNQQALDFLFGDKPWICADGKLYYWTGNYYKYSPDSEQRPRIASYCNSFSVFKQRKGLTFPFANPASAKQVLEWAKMRLEINSDSLNPPGLNCTNGVLQLHWEVTKARLAPTSKWNLVDHTPDLYYTYQPIATYNPEAVTEHCDRLMEVLSAPQQDIFLKTIAASLDLETVRKYKGRTVRALLLKGYGSNGKDTLREIVSLMYGRIGMTAATLSDFASYDEGRKFPLARTANSRVNWASENAQTARLDKIQSLKAFITGDTLSREGKGKDEEDFTPKAIAVFNCNDTPNMQGSLEAIKSRYGVLSFDKTFKVKADPTRGEIEADPRFKYDPDFLKAEVLPAFLNKVLSALVALMAEGIDYTATEAAMAAIQAENSHLFQFSQDTGLNYSPDDSLTASDIWTRLEAWYQDNGTLVYETTTNDKVKAVWFDQPKRGDHNVKGANQVLARIQALFPKVTRTTIYSATAKKSVPALKGIGFVATRPSFDPVPTQHPPQETVTQQDFRPTRPSFSNFEQNQEILEEAETETETNIENLADNFVPETVEPAETGSGGSEPLNINVSICGTGAETGSGDAETGSGGIEKPIAFSEPEPKLDAELVKQIAATLRTAISVQDAVAVREIASKSINLDKTRRLHAAVKNCLTPEENEACRILAKANQSQSQPIRSLSTSDCDAVSTEADPPTPPVLELHTDFARRIEEALGYNSPAVASAIETDLNRAIDAGQLTAADVVGVVGDQQFLDFKELVARCPRRHQKN
jgi:phage/plasmid-associated DNA primase